MTTEHPTDTELIGGDILDLDCRPQADITALEAANLAAVLVLAVAGHAQLGQKIVEYSLQRHFVVTDRPTE